MRARRLEVVGAVAAVAIAALAAGGCDQLNRPFGGTSSSSSSGAPGAGASAEDASAADDGGVVDPDGGLPGLTPEPGDVRL